MKEERFLKRQKIYRTIMLIVLTVFITFIATSIYLINNYHFGGYEDSKINNISALLNTNNGEESNLNTSIKNIKKILDKYYLYDVDDEKAVEGAISGYIESLGDPYTVYVSKDEMKEYTEGLMGNFVGIGIYMVKNTEKNQIQVLYPIEGSPAIEAGIKSGDVILSVDGVEYTGDQMDTAANNIKGDAGTKVKLVVLRGEEKLTFEIERRKVVTNPVVGEVKEDNIGYISVTSFDEDTAKSFKTKFEELNKQGIKSLIIDLRNNGGGLVSECLEMLDMIVAKDNTLLITVDKNDKEEIEKSKEDILINMPIVVLVNGNSASASEIFAGALKDLNKATLVGTKTYGKGVIQQFLSLPNGSGLKVTVEEYFTPNRTKINQKGIEPNVEVKLPENAISTLATDENDTQYKKAIEILKAN